MKPCYQNLDMKRFLVFSYCFVLLFFYGCSCNTPDKVFPDLNPYQVDRIVIDQQGYPEYVFSRSVSHTWILETEGSSFLCDNEAIMKFLKEIANVTYAHVKDKDKKVLPEAGKCPGTDIMLRQNGKEKRFSVKKAGEDYQSCYIYREGQKECMLCVPYIITLVNQPLQKWLKKSIFDVPYDDVTKLSITVDGATVSWKRDNKNSSWHPASENIPAIQEDKIHTFYRFLQDMKIHDAAVPEENGDISSKEHILISLATDDDIFQEFKIKNQKNSTFYYASRTGPETGVLLFSRTWMKKLKKQCAGILPPDIIKRIE